MTRKLTFDHTPKLNTVLGVDAAYRQARLIARPDPEWLGQAWWSHEYREALPAQGDGGWPPVVPKAR